VNHKLAWGAAGIAAVLSLPAFAGDLVTNGSFEDNFGAGQFNQTLPGTAGGQNGSAPGTTASGWTVTGTNSSYPEGYAFIFGNANSFTTTNAGVGPTSQYGNPGGQPRCLCGAVRPMEVRGEITSTASTQPSSRRRSARPSAASRSATSIPSPSTTPPRSSIFIAAIPRTNGS
jgi:hypothetical protein